MNVLTLELPHPLYFVQVYHKAVVVRVVQFDALSAKDRSSFRVIEMLDTVWVLATELVEHRTLILLIEIKVAGRQQRVFLDNFVQDVDVEW